LSFFRFVDAGFWVPVGKWAMRFAATAGLRLPVARDHFAVLLQLHVPEVAVLVEAFAFLPK